MEIILLRLQRNSNTNDEYSLGKYYNDILINLD